MMKARWFQTLVAFCLPHLVGAGFCGALIGMLKQNELFSSLMKIPKTDVVATFVKTPNPTGGELRPVKSIEADFPPVASIKPSQPVDHHSLEKLEVEPTSAMPASSVLREGETSWASKDQPAPWIVLAQPALAQPSNMAVEPRKWRPILDPVSDFWSTLWPRTDALPVVFQAVLLRDVEQVAKLVAMGFNPSERTLFGDTPLCAAVRSGQADMVQVLAMCGVDLDEPGRENQAPILVASLRRNTPVLAALTSLGVDPNTRFKSPIAKELINRCTIKDLRNAMEGDRGITPLISCAARGDVEGAVTLMKAGAKPGVCTSRYHRYPINFAATQGYLFLMRVLLGRDPDAEPETLVTVDLSSQRAWVTKNGKVIAITPVSTGREGYRTPAGRYVITDKYRSHTSTLYHCEMPWFMRLNCGAIGLHSGYVTGRPASHGCIRLPYDQAKLFFTLTSVGDEVQIVH
ncbi:MAG: hypothetical protein RIS79_3072 [Verrucomicrobiota bacterium]|jgi:hypothetical protein